MVQTRPGSKRGAAGDVLSRFHLSLTLRDYLYVSRRLAQIFNEVVAFCFVWCLCWVCFFVWVVADVLKGTVL